MNKGLGFLNTALQVAQAAGSAKANRQQHGRTEHDLEYEKIKAGETQEKRSFRWKLAGGILAGGALLFGGGKIYSAIQKGMTDRGELRPFKDEVNKSELILSEVELQSIANKLYIALNSFNIPESRVYELLGRINNYSEWNALVLKYGVRKLTGTLANFEGTLVEWLEERLDTGEVQKVQKLLSPKGVVF